jgi:hypothetical protein
MPRIPDATERTPTAYLAKPRPHMRPRGPVDSTLAVIVANLTLRGKAGGEVALANAVLAAFVALVYHVDGEDSEYTNFDPVTLRVIVAKPWTRIGRVKWAAPGCEPVMRTTEARALAYIMQQRSKQDGTWIVYRPDTKDWHVTVKSGKAAAAIVAHTPITMQEWRTAWAATRTEWSERNLSPDAAKG